MPSSTWSLNTIDGPADRVLTFIWGTNDSGVLVGRDLRLAFVSTDGVDFASSTLSSTCSMLCLFENGEGTLGHVSCCFHLGLSHAIRVSSSNDFTATLEVNIVPNAAVPEPPSVLKTDTFTCNQFAGPVRTHLLFRPQ